MCHRARETVKLLYLCHWAGETNNITGLVNCDLTLLMSHRARETGHELRHGEASGHQNYQQGEAQRVGPAEGE